MESRLAYETVLADLRQKLGEIQKAIQAIEALMPEAAQTSSLSPSTSPKGTTQRIGRFSNMTISEAAKVIISESGRESMHVSELTNAMIDGGVDIQSKDKSNTVGSILNRRAREHGDLVRVGRGMWSLVDPQMALHPIRDAETIQRLREQIPEKYDL